MRLRGLDLNLLVTLDRLLTEGNVSRAADKLCLSQSATSGALARLRDYFDDELLIQVGRKMTLTPRAEELAVATRNALMQIEGTIIEQPKLDTGTVKRNIRVMTSDYVATAHLSGAIKTIQREAPGISFTLVAPSSEATLCLSRGVIDFAVMPERYLDSDHPSRNILTDGHSVIMDENNRFLKDGPLDIETFMAMPQVTVQLADGPPNYESALSDLYGNRRKKDVIVANFSTVPFMVVDSDRAAIVHSRLARIFCRMMPLRMFDAPMDLPPLRVGVQWHEMSDCDQVLRFVKSRLLEVCSFPEK